jgi:hypothetical protein
VLLWKTDRGKPQITSWLVSMSHLVVEVTMDRVTCHPPRWR